MLAKTAVKPKFAFKKKQTAPLMSTNNNEVDVSNESIVAVQDARAYTHENITDTRLLIEESKDISLSNLVNCTVHITSATSLYIHTLRNCVIIGDITGSSLMHKYVTSL
jgi:exosome complex RNA-binding protein Csl4